MRSVPWSTAESNGELSFSECNHLAVHHNHCISMSAFIIARPATNNTLCPDERKETVKNALMCLMSVVN